MIHTEILTLPPVDRQEILRYAGARSDSPELTNLLENCLLEAQSILNGHVCWSAFPITQQADTWDLGFARIRSASLDRNLAGCCQAVVFAATIGLGIDRLIARYSRISPARALLFQAIGAERIEALCDTFCETVRADTGMFTAPRFSPGYGDLPLTLQSDIFRILDCPRKIGLTLNDSFLMSPSKSVTAILGLRSCPDSTPHTGCNCCSQTDCLFRRLP